MRSRFARDAALLQIANAVDSAASLVTSVVVFRLFGAIGYGTYAEALTLFAIIFFLGNVGLSQVTVARVAEAMGRGDAVTVTRWLAVFTKAYGFVAILLTTLGFSLGPVLGEVIYHDRTIGVWTALLCLSGPISAPFAFLQCTLAGTRRMKLLGEMENLKSMARIVLVVAGALSFGTPLGAVAGELGAAAFSIPLALLAYSKARRDSGPALPSFRELVGQARSTGTTELIHGVAEGFRVTVRKNLTA
ncbi:MAG TPA: oligosaccharide flippase family protein, partial [Planctomycetota bacterium]|nr:oligosaccharide flippase family protein [Planctomycetota bacterium]